MTIFHILKNILTRSNKNVRKEGELTDFQNSKTKILLLKKLSFYILPNLDKPEPKRKISNLFYELVAIRHDKII